MVAGERFPPVAGREKFPSTGGEGHEVAGRVRTDSREQTIQNTPRAVPALSPTGGELSPRQGKKI